MGTIMKAVSVKAMELMTRAEGACCTPIALRRSIKTIEILVKAVPITAMNGSRLKAMMAMVVGSMAGKFSVIIFDTRPIADLNPDRFSDLHQMAPSCRSAIGKNRYRLGEIELEVENGSWP